MAKAFSILHIEDSCDDADLVRLALLRNHFPCRIRRVDTEANFIAALDAERPDAILCDCDLPRFSAERALAILREKGLALPFIVVSHYVGRRIGLMEVPPDADGHVEKRDLGKLSVVIAAAMARRPGAHRAPG